MTYLIVFSWGWMVAAVVIGLAMGWISRAQREPNGGGRITVFATLLLLFAIGLSLSGIVPGRAGYALDLGVAMTIAYLGGCVIGSRLRQVLAPVPHTKDPA